MRHGDKKYDNGKALSFRFDPPLKEKAYEEIPSKFNAYVEKYQIATENRVYFYDPSISVKHDIHDHKGKLIAKEGKKVNPLDYQEMKQNLLFIDSDIEKQLHWALAEHKKNHSVIILVNGSIMQIMRDYKTRIYFDQNGFLFNSFKIKAVPAKVSQDGDLLRIEEFVLW